MVTGVQIEMVSVAVWLLAVTIVLIGEARVIGGLQQGLGRSGRVLSSADGLAIGAPLPTTPALDLRTGDAVPLGSPGRGMVVVLVSSTCGPCHGMASSLRTRSAKLPHHDLVFLCRGKRESVEMFRDEFPAGTSVLWDAEDRSKDAFACGITPFAFLFDREGRLALKGVCGSAEALETLVRADRARPRRAAAAGR